MSDNVYGWCWLKLHSWSPWIDKGDFDLSYKNQKGDWITDKKFIRQERRCKLCNKLEIRREYV